MFSQLAYIFWKVNPEMFSIGNVSVRYYGLFCFFGLMSAWTFIGLMYFREKIPISFFFRQYFFYLFGIVLGSRLGHCLFYEPGYFLTHPHEMILPFRIVDGSFVWTGYSGFASHGGTVGLTLAVILFCLRTGQDIIMTLDFTAIAVPWASFWIRMGNLMNSEILGTPADLPWSFIFTRVDWVPRHPAQLYEAIFYLLLFIAIVRLYLVRGERSHKGFYLGMCLAGIFIFRFFIEFIKENQISSESGMLINIGQWLSIPCGLVGLYFMFIYKGKEPVNKYVT
jgi:prolipoprotein diacylglyceryl transferase